MGGSLLGRKTRTALSHTRLGLRNDQGYGYEKRQEFMREINGGGRTTGATRPPTVAEFLEQVYLPFYRGKWKESTAGTSENRLRHHIGKELGTQRLEDLTLAPLQQFLEQKAASGLSFSVVDHIRWDLSSMFEMAVSEKVIGLNPTTALYTPKTAKRSEGQSMSAQQVELALGAVDFREKVILRLAVFAGMRPGELLAIQREHVKPDASVIEVRRACIGGSSRPRRTVWYAQSRSLPRLRRCFAIGWRRWWTRIPKRTCLRVRLANRSGGLPCSRIT